MRVVLEEIRDKNQLSKFIQFPFSLYKGDKNWIPPLIKDEYDTLLSNLHPDNGTQTRFVIAKQNGKTVGRIAGIKIPGETTKDGKVIARFGWVELIEDQEVAKALLNDLETWAKELGADLLQGPLGFTNLDKAGMLVQGFSELPTIVEIYNLPYYPKFLEELGYTKAVDWIAYEFEVPHEIPEKVSTFARLIAERYQVKLLEKKTTKSLEPYIIKLFQLINQTHRGLHGFVPFTEEQAMMYYKKYSRLVDPNFISLVVNSDDELVAYGITLPSMSRAFQKAKGKLYPWGFWHIYRSLKYNDHADLYLIGVNNEMRNKGVVALIFNDIMTAFIRKGIKKVDSNPELEHNDQIRRMWKNYSSRQHKRRRCFQKELT